MLNILKIPYYIYSRLHERNNMENMAIISWQYFSEKFEYRVLDYFLSLNIEIVQLI